MTDFVMLMSSCCRVAVGREIYKLRENPTQRWRDKVGWCLKPDDTVTWWNERRNLTVDLLSLAIQLLIGLRYRNAAPAWKTYCNDVVQYKNDQFKMA